MRYIWRIRRNKRRWICGGLGCPGIFGRVKARDAYRFEEGSDKRDHTKNTSDLEI